MKLRIVSAAAALLAALGGLHSPAQGQGFKPTRRWKRWCIRSRRRQRRPGARGGADDGEGEAAAGAHAGREQARRHGAVAAAYLAEKKGDQNTIGFFTGVWLTGPLTSSEAKVTLRDLTPIARLVLEPAVIAVKSDAPYKSLQDFVARRRRAPGSSSSRAARSRAATTSCASSCRSTPARSGRTSPFPAAASASPRCWAATST
jgi:hypothetical protein